MISIIRELSTAEFRLNYNDATIVFCYDKVPLLKRPISVRIPALFQRHSARLLSFHYDIYSDFAVQIVTGPPHSLIIATLCHPVKKW